MKKARKEKQKKNKVIQLNVRKRATLSKYKGKVYCHFYDNQSSKTFTFNFDEIRKLKNKLPSLISEMKNIEHHKKTKNEKCEESDNDSRSDSIYNTTGSSSSEED